MPVRGPSDGIRAFQEEFEAAHAVGGFWMPVLHPFLTGRLARWAAMEAWLDDIMEAGDVWFAPMEEIARARGGASRPCSAPTASPESPHDPRRSCLPARFRAGSAALRRHRLAHAAAAPAGPNDPEGAEIGFLGVPFDGGTTNRPGARHGPARAPRRLDHDPHGQPGHAHRPLPHRPLRRFRRCGGEPHRHHPDAGAGRDAVRRAEGRRRDPDHAGRGSPDDPAGAAGAGEGRPAGLRSLRRAHGPLRRLFRRREAHPWHALPPRGGGGAAGPRTHGP